MWYTEARAPLPPGSLLALRGGREGNERGLKPPSEEFWCHIKGQGFSVHLCAGHKAAEMVGKHPHTPKPCRSFEPLYFYNGNSPNFKIVTLDKRHICSAPGVTSVSPGEGKRHARQQNIPLTAVAFAGAERGRVWSTSEEKRGDLQPLEVFPDARRLCTL